MNKLLVEPKPYKRIFAYAIDFLIVSLIGVFLYASIGLGVLHTAFGGKEAASKLESFALDSGLVYEDHEKSSSPSIFIYNENGTEDKNNGYVSTPNGKKGYEAYLDIVWNYYTEFLNVEKNPDERVVAREGYSSSDYYKYAYEEVFGFTSNDAGENKYFTYKVEAGVIDYLAKPVLNAEYQQKVDASDDAALTSLLRYFFYEEDNAYSGVYYEAILDMEGTYFTDSSVQTYYYEQASKESMSTWLAGLICYAPLGLLFFFVIPLCSKKGQTLGKMIFKVAVADDRGFYMNWKQRVFRPLLVSIHFALFLIPNTIFGFGVYFLGAVASFLSMTLGRRRQNLHEKITHTIVIDDVKSVVFKNIVERSEYLESHDLDEKGNPNVVVTELEGQPKVVLTKED